MSLFKSYFARWAGEGRIYLIDTPLPKELLLVRLTSSDLGYCHGQIHIYSAPKVLLKHLESALSKVLNKVISLNWQSQPLKPGCYRSQMSYSAKIGCGAEIVNSLKSWSYLIFEASEFNSQEGLLYLYTKELGLYQGAINSSGQIMVSEDQLKNAIAENLRDSEIILEIEKLMGKPWDFAIEPFRRVEIDDLDTLSDRLLV